jgi:hypothetical protein
MYHCLILTPPSIWATSRHWVYSSPLCEPPTKQFYSECQSSNDLPSSQSARSIVAPISVGPRPANRQCVREGDIRCARHSLTLPSIYWTQPQQLVRGARKTSLRGEQGIPGSLLAPADSDSVHATAARTIRPTTESSVFPSARTTFVEDVISASFIAATWPEHGDLPNDRGPRTRYMSGIPANLCLFRAFIYFLKRAKHRKVLSQVNRWLANLCNGCLC